MALELHPDYQKFIKKLVETSGEEIDDATASAIARSEEQISSGKVRTLDEAVSLLRQTHFGK